MKFRNFFAIGLILLVCISSTVLFFNHHYLLLSIIIICLSLGIFYYKYDQKKPSSKELVLLSMMVVSCVMSRFLFVFFPSFKPMYALIILYGMCFGCETGFLCGSTSAFVSNYLFGQGPWTPYQMLSCGLIGFLSGIFSQFLIKSSIFRIIFSIIMAILYSLIMDIYATMSIDMNFFWNRYLITVIGSLPVVIIYCIANVFFLSVLTPILMKKFIRIKEKYGLWEENE